MNAAKKITVAISIAISWLGCWDERKDNIDFDSGANSDSDVDSDSDSDSDADTETETGEKPEDDFWENGYLGLMEDTNGDTYVDLMVPCSYDCKNIDYIGCCYGDIALFCDISNDGSTPALYCIQCDSACGWREDVSYYWCGDPDNVNFLTTGDPDGEHEMDCEEFTGVSNPVEE